MAKEKRNRSVSRSSSLMIDLSAENPEYEEDDFRISKRSATSPETEKRLSKTDLESLSSPPSKKVLLDTRTDFLCEEVLEYAADVYAWKRGLEEKYEVRHCLSKQKDITPFNRSTVLKWLLAVNHQFNFCLETWCLTVNILDRFFRLQCMRIECLQLAGLTAFFLAAKQEEMDPPEISELVTLCAHSYDSHQFRWMEDIILNHLRFDFLAPTINYFLFHLVEVEKLSLIWPFELSVCLIETLYCDYELSQESPSKMAKILFDLLRSYPLKTFEKNDTFVKFILSEIRKNLCVFSSYEKETQRFSLYEE